MLFIGGWCVYSGCNIPVVDPGPVEESAIGGAFLSDRGRTESRGAKIESSRFAGVRGVDRSYEIRCVHSKSNRPASLSPQQRKITVVNDRHRKAGGKTSNTADLPAIGEFLGAIQLVEGQVVAVADHEIMRAVERREAAAQTGIDRIVLLAIAGRDVQGFAEGIAEQRLQSSRRVPPI